MNQYPSHNTMYWAIWAFALAFIVVIFATARAAMSEALGAMGSRSETLSAPSADSGKPMEASPACVGVRTPGSARRENRNAVESILSRPARWSGSWCGFRDETILQGIATMVATKPPASPRCPSAHFPGVTDLVLVGAGRFGAHESNTGVDYPPHAAPGVFQPSHHKTKWACHEIPNRAVSAATAMQVSAVGGRDHA